MHLAESSHRPWPLPRAPWALAMRWHELCFLHWRVDPERLRARLPPGLALDTFDGEAWIGVVPFRMSGVRPRLTPPLPGVSAFLELNVRTYVVAGGKPGVWFFSLYAADRNEVVRRGEVHHAPWPLAPLTHYAHELEVAAWWPRRLRP